MKRYLAVLAFLTLGILACSLQSKGVSERPSQVYDANGVTFKYPLTWEVISPKQLNIYVTDYTYLAVLSDKDDSTGTVARFVIVQTTREYNDYITEEREYYQEHYKDRLSETTLNVNGIPAVQFETSGSSLSGETRKSLNIYFEHNHEIYYLTFSTSLESYDKVKPDIDMVVNSFQIK